ncbi:MAG: UMP kinase, partial [Oscillospiraceae bacterium]|nr:UMP kinase [Oscillospiraceae bacterium]
RQVCQAVKRCTEMGVQVGIVTGGGNYWRGVKDGGGRMERSRADQMGMLATVMNSLAMAEALEQVDVPVRVQTMIDMPRIAEPYCYGRAMHHIEKGRVVIFGGGSGNPYFSTDSAAALKAAELGADILLMAKNIDGVYTADPKTDPTAQRLDSITYRRILEEHLTVIDSTAACLLQDNAIPTMIFALNPPENIVRVVCGERIGTIVD